MNKPAQPPIIRQVQPELIIQGVEMVGQQSVGILLNTKSRSTISEWLSREGLTGTSINNRKYYSLEEIREHLRYGKVEIRQAIEILREIKMWQRSSR